MMLTSDISLLHDPERVFQGIVEEYVFVIFPFFYRGHPIKSFHHVS